MARVGWRRDQIEAGRIRRVARGEHDGRAAHRHIQAIARCQCQGLAVDGYRAGAGADIDDAKLAAFEQSKGSQLVVLIVPTTQPEAIEDYSMRVAEAWKLGRGRVVAQRDSGGHELQQ